MILKIHCCNGNGAIATYFGSTSLSSPVVQASMTLTFDFQPYPVSAPRVFIVLLRFCMCEPLHLLVWLPVQTHAAHRRFALQQQEAPGPQNPIRFCLASSCALPPTTGTSFRRTNQVQPHIIKGPKKAPAYLSFKSRRTIYNLNDHPCRTTRKDSGTKQF